MIRSISYNLRNVLNFSGRATRSDFWPYALALYLISTAVSMAIIIPMIVQMMVRMTTYVMTHPKDFPGPDPGLPPRLPPGVMPDFTPIAAPLVVINLILVLLLAAAVARRLHDRDRSGFWGLLPLPPLALGLANTKAALALATGSFDLSATEIWLYVGGLLFWPAIILLIFFLTAEGTKGPNRFGPEVV